MAPVANLIDSARTASLQRLLVVAAFLTFAGMVLEVETGSWSHAAQRPGNIAAAAIMSGCVALSAWRPALAAVIAGVALPVEAALGSTLANGSGVLALVGLILCFVLAVGTDARHFWPAFAIYAIGMQAMALIAGDEDPVGTFVWLSVILLGFPATAGRLIRWRSETNAELRDQADELERNREARAHAAGLAERRRIATELHDVVAHDVTVMLVQAQAAARMIASGRPQAAASIEEIENTGREALSEMRRLLGVLRRGDETAALAPQPRLARAQELADHVRAEGVDATVSEHGTPVPLSSGLDLTAYRILQEALSSVKDHGAATQAHAAVTFAPGTLAIELTSNGLITEACLEGIRARAMMYGGRVETSISAQGHGRLHVLLPLQPDRVPA